MSLRTGEIMVDMKTCYTHSNKVHTQGSAKRWSPGLVKFVFAPAYLGLKSVPRFGEFCYCSCLPLLPGFACSIHAT